MFLYKADSSVLSSCYDIDIGHLKQEEENPMKNGDPCL